MGRRRAIRSLVRMPDAVAIPVVDESLVEPVPAFVATEEIETRHRLQPQERERYIGVHSVPVRKYVTHDEVRLRDHFLPKKLDSLLPRQRLGYPVIDALDLAEVLVSKDRHVRKHRQGVDRWRCRLRR